MGNQEFITLESHGVDRKGCCVQNIKTINVSLEVECILNCREYYFKEEGEWEEFNYSSPSFGASVGDEKKWVESAFIAPLNPNKPALFKIKTEQYNLFQNPQPCNIYMRWDIITQKWVKVSNRKIKGYALLSN